MKHGSTASYNAAVMAFVFVDSPTFFSIELGSASSVQWFGMSSSCQEVSFHSAVDRPDILATVLICSFPALKRKKKVTGMSFDQQPSILSLVCSFLAIDKAAAPQGGCPPRPCPPPQGGSTV